MTPAPISVERLRELHAVAFQWPPRNLDKFADAMHEALPALLHQLAEAQLKASQLHDARMLAITQLEAAERAREELAHVAPLLLDLATSGECDTLSHDEVAALRKLAAFLAASGGDKP